jgi:4-amino-4-deoxy-L-arabinose transferase-like glycosyltransferase
MTMPPLLGETVGATRARRLPRHGVRALTSRRALLPLAFGVVYLVATCVVAARRPLWNDEVYTYDFAQTRGLRGLWHALETGADQAPPLSYLLTRLSTEAFGHGRLAIRLPEILAFLVFCLCMYVFVTRRTNELYGLIAMILPTVTAAGYYASEARAYALVLAFAAVALVCWQAAAAGTGHRKAALAGLAAALALATASHYYAVLVVVPLALGEITRTLRRRAVDLPVWVAFIFSALPLAAFVQLVRAAHGYAADFWGKPSWADPVRFYSFLLDTRSTVRGIELGQIGRPTVWWLALLAVGALASALVVLTADVVRGRPAWAYGVLGAIAGLTLLAAAGVELHAGAISPVGVVAIGLALGALAAYLGHRLASGPPLSPAPPLHEVVVLGAFLLLPAGAVVLAKTLTHAYTDRYALPATIGLAVLPLALHRLDRGRGALAPAALLVLSVVFAGSAIVHARHASDLRSQQAATASFLERTARGGGPIVIDNDHEFLELSFAVPRRLARRLTYVADPGGDSTQRGLLKLGAISHLRVYGASSALPRRFLVLASRDRARWADTRYWSVMRSLEAERRSIVYEAAHGQEALFRVASPARG